MSEKDFDVGLAQVGSYAIHSAPHGLPHERSASFNFGVTDGKPAIRLILSTITFRTINMDKLNIDDRKTSMRTIRLFFAACLLASPGMLQSQLP